MLIILRIRSSCRFIISIIALILLTFSGSAKSESGDTIKIIHNEYESSIATANVIKLILENELAYKTEIASASLPEIWTKISTGLADVFPDAWLPTANEQFYSKFKSEIIDLGPNFRGIRLGLAVPDYVEIDTIPDLNDNVLKFGGEIIGVEPTSGVMTAAVNAIDHYGLKFVPVPGSPESMLTVLKNKMKRREWVVVTGWTPHWMFIKWDLKFLEDPDKIFGREEFIHTIIRKGFEKTHAGAFRFLSKFHWNRNDIMEIMLLINDGGDPLEAAQKWISENQVKVSLWLE